MKTFKVFQEGMAQHYIVQDLKRRDRENKRRGVDPNNPSRMPIKQQPVFGSNMPRQPTQDTPTPRPSANNFFKGGLET